MEKLCYKCNVSKDINEFALNRNRYDRHQSMCKLCKRKNDKIHYSIHKFRKKVVQKELQNRRKVEFELLKSSYKCIKCGESDINCLDFHHKDRSKKEYAISVMLRRGFSMKRIKKEIEKCIVLCANCHRKLHAGTLDVIKIDIIGTSFNGRKTPSEGESLGSTPSVPEGEKL